MAFAEKNAAYSINTAGKISVGQICCDICMDTKWNLSAEWRCLNSILEMDLWFIRI